MKVSHVVNLGQNNNSITNSRKILSSAKFGLNLRFEMSENSLLITRSNIHELTSSDIFTFNSKEYWHKFILENGGLFDKEKVLQAVLDSITPFDLVPVKFTVDGKDAYFLARNCGQAIEKFCLNLLLPIQLKDPPGEISISIQPCSIPIDDYKMNMQFHLKKAIEKRYDGSKNGFINLSSFHKEPELYEVLFCPLSRPRFLMYVLSILKRILNITSINLSNNDIEILKSLEVLREFEGLVFLDLSNNKIKDPNLAELLGKITPTLQELNLGGNPICSTFKTEMEYLKWIRDKNHSIKKLDGVLINNGFPYHQVYLCSDKVWMIVNEFLKHYFTLYDNNRQALEHSYEKNAIFSTNYDHNSSLKDNRLDLCEQEDENFSKVNSVDRVTSVSHQKNTNVVKALQKLPLTEHDPYSFRVDVFFYEDPIIILVVSGVFKEFQDVQTPRIKSFSRTFALKRVTDEEFKIVNDLYRVTDASPGEVNSSFLYPNSVDENIESQTYVSKDEKRLLIDVVSKLTEMNYAYSKRCLEDCSWDAKKALEVFLDNYKIFNIPPEAFAEEFPT